MVRKEYSVIQKLFESHGCELYTTKDEYDNMKNPVKSKVNFKASCGHDNTVTLTNFLQKQSGLLCKPCVYKKVSDKSKEYKENNKNINLEQEYEGYKKLYNIIEEDFEIQKTNEGCLSDLIIKPKYIEDNKWMMIQIKTCLDTCHGLYTFSSQKNNYENCIVICMCLNADKMWMIDYTQFIDKNKLNIGLTKKSEYFKYQMSNEVLIQNLLSEYCFMNKYKKEICLIPRSPNQKIEHTYRLKRESQIPYLNYIYPGVDGCKTDYFINNYKIQEKVGSIIHNRTETYKIGLEKNNSQGTKTRYAENDNDFYWIWLKDKENIFYIFPESELIKHNYIKTKTDIEEKRCGFCINKTNWTKDYQYQLDDINLKNKLEKLFEI